MINPQVRIISVLEVQGYPCNQVTFEKARLASEKGEVLRRITGRAGARFTPIHPHWGSASAQWGCSELRESMLSERTVESLSPKRRGPFSYSVREFHSLNLPFTPPPRVYGLLIKWRRARGHWEAVKKTRNLRTSLIRGRDLGGRVGWRNDLLRCFRLVTRWWPCVVVERSDHFWESSFPVGCGSPPELFPGHTVAFKMF